MLSPAGAMPATPNTANARPNPLVNLKVGVEELLAADAVLLTHSRRDHFDAVAEVLLRRDIVFFCQPEDADKLRGKGFIQVQPIKEAAVWGNIRIARTEGQHGTGEIDQAMGPVSGFVLQASGEPALYIAGDTVWCREVEEALRTYRPAVTALFAGAAQFLQGGEITMTAEHIAQVCAACPDTRIIAAHMDAWNHCFLTRDSLRTEMAARGIESRVFVPEDGESMFFAE
ncbi:MBL fold metallo-hydrolase [Paenibacillus hamazuiensis]|uniref:MBL fold metallo-hydrolase n=1 Tax=Paenibacillus hamazuiensis TaxID=2936508 RepID=UPI002010BF41|nr:MBL fold metallo-hydrolase [Paenibacillus hamazuiensis]